MTIGFANQIDITCRECGSRNVTRDASVSWNLSGQNWEVAAIFDNADCNDCGGETSLDERDLESGEVIEG
jgi:hypothetical protein